MVESHAKISSTDPVIYDRDVALKVVLPNTTLHTQNAHFLDTLQINKRKQTNKPPVHRFKKPAGFAG